MGDTHSHDGLKDLLTVHLFVPRDLVALDVVGDVVEQRVEVGRLKELIGGDELQGDGGHGAKLAGGGAVGDQAARLHGDVQQLLIVGVGEAVAAGDAGGGGEAQDGRHGEDAAEDGHGDICFGLVVWGIGRGGI